jgi:hypothetical protein
MGARTYPVPSGAQTGLLASASTATLDELDTAGRAGNEWANRIAQKEHSRVLSGVLDGDAALPVGITADGDVDCVVALYRKGRAWRGTREGWIPVEEGELLASVMLDRDEVAFVASAFDEGADTVVLRAYFPLAWLTAAAGDDRVADEIGEGVPEGDADLPEGAKAIAVVDDLDKSAVMDLVAVLPGPLVMRRHDGEWREDPKWLTVLRSVKPPPIVVLDDTQLASVIAQIDEQTAGADWVDTDTDDYLNASAWDRADEMALEFALQNALIAGPVGKAASKATPGGRTPAQLRKYWTVGPGAAKIRWGTPGAWRRCFKNLVKYVGPKRAPGQCTNLAKALGGHGVATHVGS